MRLSTLLTSVLLCIAGCDNTNRVDSPSSSAYETPDSFAGPPSTESAQDAEKETDSLTQVVFNLSDVATDKVRTAIAAVGGTHLVVSVDVDDEKYCIGFHYNLKVAKDPLRSRFAFVESNGVNLAIEKDDIKFLNGTMLDYETLASGGEGFVFRNPNENVSLPDELQGKQLP